MPPSDREGRESNLKTDNVKKSRKGAKTQRLMRTNLISYVFIYDASNDFQSSYFEFYFIFFFAALRESKSYVGVTKSLSASWRTPKYPA